MSTPRDRGESTQVDCSPEEQECPVGQQAWKERYHKPRWILRLDQPMKVVSHCLECGHTTCTQPAVVYRPQQEDALAVRGYPFGLAVVARIGA
jgi:hypothetical protein